MEEKLSNKRLSDLEDLFRLETSEEHEIPEELLEKLKWANLEERTPKE